VIEVTSPVKPGWPPLSRQGRRLTVAPRIMMEGRPLRLRIARFTSPQTGASHEPDAISRLRRRMIEDMTIRQFGAQQHPVGPRGGTFTVNEDLIDASG
jgi:hypothetical protein